MKTGLTLIAGGLLILSASLAWWITSLPADQVGDAASVEQRLTSTTAVRTQPPPRGAGAPEPAAPAPSIPQFTFGQKSQAGQRIPTTLRIPALEIAAPVTPAGVEPNGDMEVPDRVSEVGWYKHGPAPGEPGSAVLAAHVDLASQGPGVFFNLRTLEPGDAIHVDFDDGTTQSYLVAARMLYDKTELPTDAIFSREGPPTLTLVTCGGGFNQTAQSYDSNVVVYAVPLDEAPTGNSDRIHQSRHSHLSAVNVPIRSHNAPDQSDHA